jgi:2-C-methyl-D-erythritol 2,4-cyclodiphosphate synthase
MFPDNDPANRMRDSLEMLTLAMSHLRDRGWRANNVDITVIAEEPRISPYREAMRDALAAALNLDRASVSVKGKTNEGMGWIGRGEGIACIATATIVPIAS